MVCHFFFASYSCLALFELNFTFCPFHQSSGAVDAFSIAAGKGGPTTFEEVSVEHCSVLLRLLLLVFVWWEKAGLNDRLV